MPHQPAAESPLAAHLDHRTAEGVLYEHLPEDAVRCVACGHRCLIRDGRRGICKVRYNEGGTLYVPRNYVAALQCDPVEKKPFNHVLPGSHALTFGMLGCDLHCGYCFPGETLVLTDRGPSTFQELFESASQVERQPDGEVALVDERWTVAGSGAMRRIRAVFRHSYKGELVAIRPYYLPTVRCTPDHRIYATTDPTVAPQPVHARSLTRDHLLAIPRTLTSSKGPQHISTLDVLADVQPTHRVTWKLSPAERDYVMTSSAAGVSSREIGAALGKSGSYIRHVRRKLALYATPETRLHPPRREGDWVRFPHGRGNGIPAELVVNADLAALLGYYCAEGCVASSKDRPNSHQLSFSFGRGEDSLALRVRDLLRDRLGVEARVTQRHATVVVTTGQTSAALLFQSLAGKGAARKRVPAPLFSAGRDVVRAFLDAYIEGDGHRYSEGKITATTISQELAYGVAWLVLRLGHLCSIYDKARAEFGTIQGRPVKQAPHQYAVVWYENSDISRRTVPTDAFHLVPIRALERADFEGTVYNMEVEEEHNYLANMLLVSNCQNWLTSQSLRDPNAGVQPLDLTAGQLVDYAGRCGARLVVSSYNEPLITSEWAVEVFRAARPRGLLTGFVSNGNATPEALDYVRPHADCYKIDLKTMSDRNYRRLGATLERVLDSIRLVYERGLWLEVVTLVIPGFSDDEGQLRDAAAYIASVSPDIPWHVTAFHEDYKFYGMGGTAAATLVRACEIGREAGLRFVYAGNLPGRVGRWEHTYCPGCDAALVERTGYRITANRLGADGRCPSCATKVPGIWTAGVRR